MRNEVGHEIIFHLYYITNLRIEYLLRILSHKSDDIKRNFDLVQSVVFGVGDEK